METTVNNLFICKCSSPEHQLIFSYDKSDTTDEGWVYTAVHLTKFGFWKRLWHGIKYIFGHRSIYGDFDEFIFKTEDAGKLQEVVDYLKHCGNETSNEK